jgi:hypothetical protein
MFAPGDEAVSTCTRCLASNLRQSLHGSRLDILDRRTISQSRLIWSRGACRVLVRPSHAGRALIRGVVVCFVGMLPDFDSGGTHIWHRLVCIPMYILLYYGYNERQGGISQLACRRGSAEQQQ